MTQEQAYQLVKGVNTQLAALYRNATDLRRALEARVKVDPVFAEACAVYGRMLVERDQATKH